MIGTLERWWPYPSSCVATLLCTSSQGQAAGIGLLVFSCSHAVVFWLIINSQFISEQVNCCNYVNHAEVQPVPVVSSSVATGSLLVVSSVGCAVPSACASSYFREGLLPVPEKLAQKIIRSR